MARLEAVSVTDLAGYKEISWQGLRPGENLLVGRNGAGKSTLLEAIVVGLNFLNGKRSGDLLNGANQRACIHLAFSDGTELTRTLGEIRSSQTAPNSRPVENVLYVHEGRRPKSRVGKSGRSRPTMHPTRRYEYVLNELQALLRGDARERAWVDDLLQRASAMRHAGHPAEWQWIRQELPGATQRTRRPVSCGQYDVLSLLLDVLRVREAVEVSHRTPFVVVDNPEAFLHPALQQEVLQLLQDILPDAQLFLASHSLKLLAHAAPASVFWLSRDLADAQGHVTVAPVRDLAPDGRGMFYELYGDDTSSAVLNLTLGLESSEYLAFLCACALPCQSVARPEPVETDEQIRAILDELRDFSGAWTLIDVGAGAGDLLVGAERLGIANSAWEYIAVQAEPSALLLERLSTARSAARVAPTSRIVDSLENAPGSCDAVVFANTCHAFGPERLAEWLAIALERLRPGPDARCVIHEVEVLRHGERDFVLWTPEDFRDSLRGIPGVAVEERPCPRPAGVPIHTTLLSHSPGRGLPADLASRIRLGLAAILPAKLVKLLRERDALSVAAAPRTLGEALVSRRRAFVSEQCSNIIDILCKSGATPWIAAMSDPRS